MIVSSAGQHFDLCYLLPPHYSTDYSVTGHGRLKSRPLNELISSMQEHGCVLTTPSLPFRVNGKLRSGIYKMPGNVSSQYISGLMLALPLLEGDSRIELTSPLSSAPYLEMTLDTLRLFGIEITKYKNGWHVKGAQKYTSPGKVTAEGGLVLRSLLALCGRYFRTHNRYRAQTELISGRYSDFRDTPIHRRKSDCGQ